MALLYVTKQSLVKGQFGGNSLLPRLDILVQPEEVGRVVPSLYLPEPVPGSAGISRAYSLLAIISKEVDVYRAIAPAQGLPEPGNPGLVRRRLVGPHVDSGGVRHDAALAVRVCRGLDGHTSNRAAEHPKLHRGHHCGRSLEMLEDSLG